MIIALLYFVGIIICGLASITLLLIPVFSKRINYKVSFIVAGLLGLVVTGYLIVNLVFKVYNKTRKEYSEIKESITNETIVSSDTSVQLKKLISYEPLPYKGKVPYEFYTSFGAFDWWRYPLVYPYSITCIDVRDYGTLSNDLNIENFNDGGSKPVISPYFDLFTFDGKYFIGKITADPFGQTIYQGDYFILNFYNSDQQIIKRSELYKVLSDIEFKGDTSFITIEEYASKF